MESEQFLIMDTHLATLLKTYVAMVNFYMEKQYQLVLNRFYIFNEKAQEAAWEKQYQLFLIRFYACIKKPKESSWETHYQWILIRIYDFNKKVRL